MTAEHVPQPFVAGCGCITTTEGQVEHLGAFEKRITTKVVTTFCNDHREQYQGGGTEEISSFRTKCRLCMMYCVMSFVFAVMFLAAAVRLYYVAR